MRLVSFALSIVCVGRPGFTVRPPRVPPRVRRRVQQVEKDGINQLLVDWLFSGKAKGCWKLFGDLEADGMGSVWARAIFLVCHII